MKKLFLTMVTALMSATMSFAQDVQMATLQHGESMTAYYGANAFVSAMAAAEEGDLISLSAGSFNATDITKAVKIQGAGYVQDATNNRFRTTISSSFSIQIPDGQEGLMLEGLYMPNTTYVKGNLKRFIIKRCLINLFDFNNYRGIGYNGHFLQSRIHTLKLYSSQNILISNSVFYDLGGESNITPTVKNCIFLHYLNGNIAGSYYNSFIYNLGSNSNRAFYNNVFNGGDTTANSQGNWHLTQGYNDLFVNSRDNTWSDGSDWILTNEAAAQYIGTDGTQIGLYGGETPFTDVPSNPQITSKQIATQSDANGKLSVKITVEAQK